MRALSTSPRVVLGGVVALVLGVLSVLTPVGIPVLPASAAEVSEDGGSLCTQNVSSNSGVTVGLTGTTCLLTFASNNSWTIPPGVGDLSVLVVGGGGGGGSDAGSGGGGGALLEGTLITGGAYRQDATIVVGAGGTAGSWISDTYAGAGGLSSFTVFDASSGSIVASAAGGKGGSRLRATETETNAGANDGSGGAQPSEPTDTSATSSWSSSTRRSGGAGGSQGIPYDYNEPRGAGVDGTGGGTSALFGGSFGGGGGSGANGNFARGQGFNGGGDGAAFTESSPTQSTPGASLSGGGGGSGGAHGDDSLRPQHREGADGGSGVVKISYTLTPDPPTSVSVSSIDGGATLTYTNPTHWGGGTLDLEYRVDSGSGFGSWTSLGETDGVTDISLANGSVYDLELKAVNSLGYESTVVDSLSVLPSPQGEILRLDATHSSSYSGSGVTWNDESGEENDSTISNDGGSPANLYPTWNSRTKAFELDGTGDYIEIQDLTYNFSDGFAIHAVFDFGNVASEWEGIVDLGTTDDSDYIAFLRSGAGTSLTLQVLQDSGTVWTCDSSAGAIQSGFHTYSAVVGSDGSCEFLVDGTSYSGTDNGETLNLPNSTLNDNWIGKSNLGNLDTEGAIQSLIVYNTDQAVPTCNPIEDTFTGNGTIGESDVPYKTLQFTTVGECEWSVPSGVTEADLLVVGGGGGGGAWVGGGGAGGQVEPSTDESVSGTLSITVGAGGVGAGFRSVEIEQAASSGADSTVSQGGSTLLTAAGGSHGGGNDRSRAPGDGTNGGGGGNAPDDGGDGTEFDGGDGSRGEPADDHYLGGGGAGASGDGENATNSVAGAGGPGLASTFTGVSVTYGGGGGGGVHGSNSNTDAPFTSYTAGSGGAGGGGAGGAATDLITTQELVQGEDGQSGLGGGGGGAGKNGGLGPPEGETYTSAGGQGGSGIVIVRYRLSPDAPTALSADAQNTQASLSWSAPTYTGGSPISDYTIEYRLSGGTWQTFSDGTSNETSVIVTGLTRGATYEVRVSAIAGGVQGANVSTTMTVPEELPSESGDDSSSSAQTPETETPAPPADPAEVGPSPTTPSPSPAAAPTPTVLDTPVTSPGESFDVNVPPRALIGGVPASVTMEASESLGVEVRTGSLQLGFSISDSPGSGEVGTNPSTGAPELTVPSGKSTRVAGGGLLPGSVVQLWLPSAREGPRELARIPVQTDGSFDSEVALTPDEDGEPVPVGRQAIQVAGYDEEGNQAIVDMTINIGQAVPAPELNRQVGALPDLGPGESLATSAGIPESVSITGVSETGSVVVEGNSWVIGVRVDRGDGTVENIDEGVLVRLTTSAVASWSGSGFIPGSLATVWLFSEPTLMTTVTIDENGDFSSEFLVDPRLIAPGEHTLQVQGVGADGYIKAANLGVLVEQPVELTSGSGSSMLWWVAGVGVLALLVMGFLLARRRRLASLAGAIYPR